MSVKVAKSAGFCFGVANAVTLTEKLVSEGRRVATLGPLIHNPQWVESMVERGLVEIEKLDDLPDGYELVIRSHGITKQTYDEILRRGIVYHDATCKYVSRIALLAQQAKNEGREFLIAGDKDHPEVQGIVSHYGDEAKIFFDFAQFRHKLLGISTETPLLCVAQTTYLQENWAVMREFIKKHYTNALIFDTICNATCQRQSEVTELAKQCDLFIVVGGKNSSNTRKLVDVAGRYTNSIGVQTVQELSELKLGHYERVGISAGASTPSHIIMEVIKHMNDQQEKQQTIIEDGMTFEEMLEASFNPIFRGKVLKGVVTGIAPTEITVDIGTKHTGFVPLDELTDDITLKPHDIVQKGDEIELMVIQVNDLEGIALLSKKRLEAREGNSLLLQAAEDGSAVEAYISEVVKGGLVAMVKGTKVFIPASQATLRRGEDFASLVKTTVKLKILEANGNRVIGSIRAVLAEIANKARDEFWSKAKVGDVCQGTVKSLASYGAFVDIGGVDGLVHISELSWSRIKHPSDVLKVDEKIEVYVKELDPLSKKISLGYRKEEDNPWTRLAGSFNLGDKFTGPVVSLTKFGAFVQVLPGIDGLVHISEISHERVDRVADALQIGEMVNVVITELDSVKKRISLSIKALLPLPEVNEPTATTETVAEESAPAPVEAAVENAEVVTEELKDA